MEETVSVDVAQTPLQACLLLASPLTWTGHLGYQGMFNLFMSDGVQRWWPPAL